jgi:hypothetical protein
MASATLSKKTILKPQIMLQDPRGHSCATLFQKSEQGAEQVLKRCDGNNHYTVLFLIYSIPGMEAGTETLMPKTQPDLRTAENSYCKTFSQLHQAAKTYN